MAELNPRLRAVCDMHMSRMREHSGRHEYDGRVQDLSPAGVRAGLARLADAAAAGHRVDDPHDEAHLAAFERATKVMFDDLAAHATNPFPHLANLDLAGYDREYAPAGERAAARAAHLAAWPEAVDGSIESMDSVAAPVAAALIAATRGLEAGIPADADPQVSASARAAHGRLVDHLTRAATDGEQDAALGSAGLTTLLSSSECIDVDLGKLAERADAERDRLTERLAESCARIDPDRDPLELARELVRDYPAADEVVAAAENWTRRAIEFTRSADLVPYHDGECRVGLAPPSRRWAMAMMSSTAAGEAGPSWYHISPPDPAWPERDQREWMEVFSNTTLPGITVHEVAPGHFSHGLAIRRAPTEIRRILHSNAFIEGWAHYGEELCVEEGFCADDPRFAIGVWLEALVRVTRLACAIGVHTAGMTVAEGARRFSSDTHITGAAALSEANRATFDPTYGRYTWGKLEIMALRERAKREWGAGFTLQRFHAAMLDLGSPPLGLLGTAIERG